MASFVSLFIPAEIVRDVGLPLKEFHIWTDDWEYTRRISRRYPCWLVPSSKVVHDTERNAGADLASADPERTDRFRFLYRNDVYLYRREGIRGFMYETARLARHTARIAINCNSTAEKCRRLRIMYKATLEGLSFRPVPEKITEKCRDNYE
jgi:GT2 family glycosyltransferase